MIVFGGTSVDGDHPGRRCGLGPGGQPLAAPPRLAARRPRRGRRGLGRRPSRGVGRFDVVLPDDAPDDADRSMKNDGSAYVPATDRWVPVPAAPIVRPAAAPILYGPAPASSSPAATTRVTTTTAPTAPPSTRSPGAWSPIAARPTPGSCGGGSACAGVWTGKVALFPVAGLAYDPAGDRWSTMAPSPSPDGPAPGEPAVWTGRRLLSWGISGDDSDDASASTPPTRRATRRRRPTGDLRPGRRRLADVPRRPAQQPGPPHRRLDRPGDARLGRNDGDTGWATERPTARSSLGRQSYCAAPPGSSTWTPVLDPNPRGSCRTG